MSRIGLFVGIDDYPSSPLNGCVSDAETLADILDRDADGSPNVQGRTLLSTDTDITRGELRTRIRELFEKADTDFAIFTFSGHGMLNSDGRSLLVTPDCSRGDEGIDMSDVIGWASMSVNSWRATGRTSWP